MTCSSNPCGENCVNDGGRASKANPSRSHLIDLSRSQEIDRCRGCGRSLLGRLLLSGHGGQVDTPSHASNILLLPAVADDEPSVARGAVKGILLDVALGKREERLALGALEAVGGTRRERPRRALTRVHEAT